MKHFLIPNIWEGKWDDSPGVGHEFRNWLTGYNLADYHNLTFVHAPFVGSHVVPENKWKTVGRVDVPVERWESFLNFGQNELIRQDLPEDIDVVQLPKIVCHANANNPQFTNIIKSYNKHDKSILFVCPFNQFLSMRWNLYRHNRFKDKYWNKRIHDPISIPFANDRISVGVHIRRCDVNPRRYPDRFLPNSYYEKILKQILELYSNADIHIYSDAASMNEFVQLSKLPNTTFHLCTDVFESFHSLVASDIYVTSTGSWAILTSCLNKGIKITTAWNDAWNKFPTDIDVVPTNKHGIFDKSVLMEKLSQNKEKKNNE